MKCTHAAYADHPAARSTQRRISREFHFATNLRYCDICDRYYLVANTSRMELPKRAMDVLRLMGEGYSSMEIARMLGITYRSVQWMSRAMQQRFNALSSNHLIAIAIALGVLNPNEFVAPLEEPNGQHYTDPNSQSATVQRTG